MEESFNLKVEYTPRIRGEVTAPSSKSYTQRALIIGGMDGDTEIINPLRSDDTMNAVSVIRALGAEVEDRDGSFPVKGFNGKPRPVCGVINVGENGTLLRFVLAILSLGEGEFKVDGEKSLKARPNRSIVNALKSLGVEIEGTGGSHLVPVRIKGKGNIRGGEVVIDGRTTSQAVSALLAVAPLASGDVVLRIQNELVSSPYVDITLDVLKRAGIRVERDGYRCFSVKSGQRFGPVGRITVHGDYSSAAFLMAAAVLTESDVTIKDLADDCQGDKKIVDILEAMGAEIKRGEDCLMIKGPFDLRGIDVDCADTPDLVPVLTVLGCFAGGSMRIYNVSHLLYKESNRLAQPAGELKKLGAKIVSSEGGLVIEGSRLNPGEVFSWGDHRVAMALAVAGLRIKGGLTIGNAECINKSYPGFIGDMKGLNAKMEVRG